MLAAARTHNTLHDSPGTHAATWHADFGQKKRHIHMKWLRLLSSSYLHLYMVVLGLLCTTMTACKADFEVAREDSTMMYLDDLNNAAKELDWFKSHVKIGMSKKSVVDIVGGPSVSREVNRGEIAEELIYYIRRDVSVIYNIGNEGKVVGISYSGFKYMINRLGVDFSGNKVNTLCNPPSPAHTHK